MTSSVRGFGRWLRSRPKKFTIPAAVLFLALVSLGAYQAVNAYDYMENNPQFCRSCHIMETAWDRWVTSEHRSVNCHDCHKSSTIDDMKLLLKFALLRPDQVGTHAVVRDEACTACHESDNPRWVQVAATAGHLVHAEEQNIACTKCHAMTLHRFQPPGPICLVCHEEQRIEVTGMANFHCTACHEYLAEANGGKEHPLFPTREGCLECHQTMELGVTWPEDAPMQFPCGECHKPHVQAKPTVDCQSCHATVGEMAIHTVKTHAAKACQVCHQPHEWRLEGTSQGQEACRVCHGNGASAPVEATPTPEATAGPDAEATATPGSAMPTPTLPVAAPTATLAPTTTAPASGPPAVPHSLEGRSECTLCHGPSGIKPYPANHAGRTSDTCLVCHRSG